MEVKLNKTDELNGIISLSIVESDYAEKVNHTLSDYRRKANIPGFRPGKVPMGVIKKQVGTKVLVDEVNNLISNNLMKFISSGEVDIVGEPMPNEENMKNIDFTKDKEFKFKFNIGIAPEFEIKLSKRNKIVYYKINVDEKMINDVVENYSKQFGSLRNDFETVEGEEEMLKGDFVQVDKDGTTIEDGISVENAVISLTQVSDKDSIKIIKGSKKGDVLSLDIKKLIPHEADLAHMLSIEKEDIAELIPTFTYTLKDISKHVASEINTGLFDKVFEKGTVKTEEEFKAKIKSEKEEQLAKDQDYRFSIDAKEKILDKTEINLPIEFLKSWLKSRDEKLTDEVLKTEWPKYLIEFKWQLFRKKFLAENEITITDEDLVEAAKEVTTAQFKYYGAAFNLPEEELEKYAKQLLENNEQRTNIRERVYEQKVTSALKDKVGLSEKEISIEDFNKLFEDDKKK